MDSLKLTKGSGGSKSSTSSIPLAIRFNAEEESIEEFIKPSTNNESTTLLNSPQQNLEDFSWKTIQGNLFSRNRSGSIEGISTTVNLLPSSDTNTIGTWKLIKGKVSQAMEDIKSSKSVQISNKNENIVNDQDSDQETSSINISVNDDIPPSSDNLNSPILSTIPKVKLGLSSLPVDSDSDNDIESTVDDTQTTSSLSFRKSLANLRSKSYIKTKVRTSKHKQTTPSPTSQSAAQIPYLQQQQQKQNPHKKDESPSRFSSSFPSTKSESFLKMKRKYDKTKRGSSTSNENKSKKDNEIESGIEVCEDMILPSGNSSLDDISLQQQSKKKNRDSFKSDSPVDVSNSSNVLGISITDETITFRHRLRTSTQDIFDDKNQIVNNEKKINDSDKLSSINYNLFNTKQQIQNQQQQKQLSFIEKFNIAWANITKKFYAISTVVLLISILILPLPGFFCGVFTCLFTISLISCIIDYLKVIITNKTKNDFGIKSIDFHNFSSSSLSFDGKFKIPNNLQLQVCEIPAAEEHLSLKSYSGWMNEINNYDPANHHLSMTTPVFVKLSGSMLILSNTTARIPKRAMWNETIIDKDNITFTRTRCFNLLGCRVEMCPKGLARKRHFSRKYPIQLIIKNLNPTVEKSHVRSSKPNDLLLLEQQQLQQQQQVSDMKIEQKETNRSNSTGEDGLSNLKSITNTNNIDLTEMKRHSLNESGEDLSDKSCNTDRHSSGGGFDFGSIVSNSDLQKLQSNYDVGSKEGVPCGDETRLLLFARCDREKEDWYRRFNAASRGLTFDQQEHIPDIVMFTEDEIAVAVKATSNLNESEEALTNATTEIKTKPSKTDDIIGTNTNIDEQQETRKLSTEDNLYEGVLITSCALRNPTDFIRFMAKYQKACFQSSNCPASTTNKVSTITTDNNAKRNRRQKSKEDDLWKGIDQAVFKQQSGNVVWFNILIGRILYNCLNNKELLDRIQEFLQRKLSAIRLPSFMEDVIIDELDLGDTPPLIHRVSQPLLDERGTWVDADISYEGLMHMTITTKLNLLRLKRQQHHEYDSSSTATTTNSTLDPTAFNQSISANNNNGVNNSPPKMNSNSSVPFINSAIYDSNAESTGASSSESESQTLGTIDPTSESHSTFYTTPGSSRRFLRIVDRITASNLFQSATEISYIQRAMENMSTKITLKVELKGLVSRVVVNIPPPPSDRVWLAFRGPPRLWISAKPTVGEHAFDWSIVTTIIENKLCDEVYKYLVYPNMVDIIVPILGESTYKEDN